MIARPARARRAGALALACALAACGRTKPVAPATGAAQSLAAIVATCAVVVGEVEVRRAGKQEWSRVTTGAVLRDGDAVRTAAGAFARIEFASGNGVELEESTLVTVDVAPRLAEGGGSEGGERVAIGSGVARGFFAERPESDMLPLTVRAADGAEARLRPAAGERKVRFRLSATRSGTEIAVVAGVARVLGPKGEVSVAAGHAVDLGAAGLGAEAELLPFPTSLRPSVDERFALGAGPVALAWEAAPEARSYRVQVARDLSFRELVLARDLGETQVAFVPPGPGMYAWRVAARDAAGRCGEFGFARRVYLDAAPPRDLLLAPAPDATVRVRGGSSRVRFAWAGERKARAYRLVLASTPDLTEREVRAESTGAQTVELRGLAPGVYWWGVYVDDEGRDPLFVKPRRLVVQRPPKVKVPRAVNQWGR